MHIVTQPLIGPFGWPKYENNKTELPINSGLYLTTFKFKDGFIPWGVGITNRPIRKRFLEHAWKFKHGEYNILDLQSALTGQRVIAWKGWGWTDEKRKKFEESKDQVINFSEKQFLETYIFIADLPKPIRLERLESALTDHFHASGNVLIDHGMQLSRRWKMEFPILVKFDAFQKIYGLPNEIQI